MNKVKGAFWIKEKNGKTWLSGNVEIDGVKHNLTLFTNDFATAENKQPNWRSPKDEQPQGEQKRNPYPTADESSNLPF